MAGSLFSMPRQAPLNDGAVVPGGKLHFSLTGTATPAATYTTPDLSVAHANPVVADSDGVFSPIYLDPANGRYRVRWVDSADVQLSLDDNVPSENNSSQSYTVASAAPFIDMIETDASANNGKWRIQAQAEALTVFAANDALSVFTPLLRLNRSGTTSDLIEFLSTDIQVNGDSIIGSQFGYKSASTDRSSTTALADDPDLVLALQATASYRIDLFVLFTGVTTGTQGFKYTHAYSGLLTTTGLGQGYHTLNSVPTVRVPFTVTGTSSVGTIAVSANSDGLMHTFFVRTTTAGNLSFQWAQNSSDANATRVITGSFIQATRLL